MLTAEENDLLTRTAADRDERYWRITQFLLPSRGTGPSAMLGWTYFGFTIVPITDESCWMFTYAWNPQRVIGEEERFGDPLGRVVADGP